MTGEHVAAAIRNGTFTGEEHSLNWAEAARPFLCCTGQETPLPRAFKSSLLDAMCVSMPLCLQHDTAIFNFSSFLFLLAATRESQYGSKPFEQTLSVDLCGTAGKHPPSSLTTGQR